MIFTWPKRDPCKWRRVFAWVPHHVGGDCYAWLQFIERRVVYRTFGYHVVGSDYEYRLPDILQTTQKSVNG
jgi:hypothetical protein